MKQDITKENIKQVISKVVTAELANLRKAAAKTKKRGEVSGGGKKPWKQKGTGRARAGSSRSPLWRGGGVAFGPQGNQNYSKSLNKKEKDLARKVAFETKESDTLKLDVPKITKTKEAATFLAKNGAVGKVLVLLSSDDREIFANLKRCFKNIPTVNFSFLTDTSTYQLLKADKIVILEKKTAVKKESK